MTNGNEIATQNNGGTEVALPGVQNAWEQYGQEADRSMADILKCIDGEWSLGADSVDVAIGAMVMLDMNELEIGWNRWSNGQVSDRVMGLIRNGFSPPRRGELGDHDESMWELDSDGRPRDPWAFTNVVPVIMGIDWGDGDNEEERAAQFSPSSRGGIGALGKVAKIYGPRMRQYPDELPICELQSDKYFHKGFGRKIKFPVFNIVGWATAEDWLSGELSATDITNGGGKKKKGGRRKAKNTNDKKGKRKPESKRDLPDSQGLDNAEDFDV